MVKFYLAGFQNKTRWYPFARILEVAEAIEYSHVEIIAVNDGDFENAISYGSVFPFSRKIKLKDLRKHYSMMWVVPLRKMKTDIECFSLLDDLTNKRVYAFDQIITIAFRIISFFKLKCLDGIKLNLSRFLICTELCGIFMEEMSGYKLPCSAEMMTLTETKEVAINNLLRDE